MKIRLNNIFELQMPQTSLIQYLEALTNFYQRNKDYNRATVRIMLEALQKSINLRKVTSITNRKHTVEQDIFSCFCLQVNMKKLKWIILFKLAVKKGKIYVSQWNFQEFLLLSGLGIYYLLSFHGNSPLQC